MNDYFGNNLEIEYQRVPWVLIKKQQTRELLGVCMHAVLALFIVVLCLAPLALGIVGVFYIDSITEPSVGVTISIVGVYIFFVLLGVNLYEDAEPLAEDAASGINNWVDKPAIREDIKADNEELRKEAERSLRITIAQMEEYSANKNAAKAALEKEGYVFIGDSLAS